MCNGGDFLAAVDAQYKDVAWFGRVADGKVVRDERQRDNGSETQRQRGIDIRASLG